MGIIKSYVVNHYFLSDFCSIYFVSTYARFVKIGKHVNFINEETLDNQDLLSEVKSVLDVLKKFYRNLQPHRDLSIDDGIIAFNLRSMFKRYMPAKPTK